MVGQVVSGLGMDEDGEPVAVEHQPGNDPRELARREGHLVHGPGVRADGFIPPSAEPHLEARGESLAQTLGLLPARRVVVDVGVIAADGVRPRRRRSRDGS